MEEPEVKAWLVAMQDGDWVRYNALRERVFNWIFRISLSILRSEFDAEEAAAHTCFKLYINRDRYDAAQEAKPYVRIVAKRTAMDILRRRDLAEHAHRQDPLSSPDTQIDGAIESELAEALRRCMKKLSERHRQALLYRIFGGPKPGREGPSLHRDVSRARQKLRECLRAAGHEFSQRGETE